MSLNVIPWVVYPYLALVSFVAPAFAEDAPAGDAKAEKKGGKKGKKGEKKGEGEAGGEAK